MTVDESSIIHCVTHAVCLSLRISGLSLRIICEVAMALSIKHFSFKRLVKAALSMRKYFGLPPH